MTYGGFKIITAVPMTTHVAVQNGHKSGNSREDDGYEVTYEDGYKSWSPKSVFDKAYTPLELRDVETKYGQINPDPSVMHPAIVSVLKYFSFAHLPPHLQEVSAPFAALAYRTARKAAQNQETTVALRKLLEAKDAAVRSVLP